MVVVFFGDRNESSREYSLTTFVFKLLYLCEWEYNWKSQSGKWKRIYEMLEIKYFERGHIDNSREY